MSQRHAPHGEEASAADEFEGRPEVDTAAAVIADFIARTQPLDAVERFQTQLASSLCNAFAGHWWREEPRRGEVRALRTNRLAC